MKRYDWILFDADHTLFDFDRSSKAALESALAEQGFDVLPRHFEMYYQINKQCWRAFEDGEIDRPTLRRLRFERFFEAAGLENDDPEAFNINYLSRLPHLPFFMNGALDLLDALFGHYRLGIVTNGMKEVQRPRLEMSGIDRYFEVIVVSGEIGVAKPDHAYFAYTHDRMGQPDKEQVLMVGDNLNSDVRGAQQFGYRGCWYNPGGVPNGEPVTPDFQIRALNEVHRVLGH
ncbi:MAG: YjjG family noncanonical pyrimidine nucleotidase [Saprospiraceae bacterium]|nr:YjjG family noncanonical pyrimidine nucleotidase [Saprospiraceae bacterium]